LRGPIEGEKDREREGRKNGVEREREIFRVRAR
jgi:hypothetical protein